MFHFVILKPALATNLAEQTQAWGDQLTVWQMIQELGSNLSGKAYSFTFRVFTQRSNINQFDFTALNTRIFDKDNNNSSIIPCISSASDPLNGLTFSTEGIPIGYEDVTVDFSCRNYNFIPGHRYLIRISNANIGNAGSGRIMFAAVSYLNKGNLDYFTGGGLRYGHGNVFDFSHNSGSCNPVTYIWGDTNPTPSNGCFIWTTAKDDLYFILSDTAYQPPAPSPFLDLPWDYEGKGLSFNEAAQSINSFFDHEYPLLSAPALSEPTIGTGTIINYLGPPRVDKPYSTHDGYDYAKTAKVNLGDAVLAAAAGDASYVNTCSACGNMIVIDHGNGYQTRYLHLQKDGLITDKLGDKVTVKARQQIGKVGATGNVKPTGDAGAHIHFGVFKDKNKDGNFDDNIPDGVTDPFGWQSNQPDPWETYTFFYNSKNRTGNKSYYLWTKKIDHLDATLTSNGGIFKTERFTLNFPNGSTNQNLILNLQSSPIVKISNSLVSIGSTIIVTAKDALGNLITQFQKLFTVTVSFSGSDLSSYNLNTVAIYSSSDGVNWTKEPTTIDLTNQTATAQVNHFTHFALMAERLDTTAPTTTANLSGDQGQPGWFRSDVKVTLDSKDNEGGLGVDYTMYRLPGGDWEIYVNPLTFTNEGHQKIEFYSADKDENLEDIKSVEFDIDKTAPEAKIFIDQDKQDLVVEGVDNNPVTIVRQDNTATKKKDDAFYLISDIAGNSIKLDVRERDKEKQDRFSIYSIQYNNNPTIILTSNHFNVTYKGKKEKSNVVEENFELKGEVKIRIKYDSRNNKSTIITNANGQEKVKEVKDGLILLQLKTNQGNLEYSY